MSLTATAVDRILDDVFANLGLIADDREKPEKRPTQAEIIIDLLVSRQGRVVSFEELCGAIGGSPRNHLYVVMMCVKDMFPDGLAVQSVRGLGYKAVRR